MKYLEPSFHHFSVGSEEYRNNWDNIFKKIPELQEVEQAPKLDRLEELKNEAPLWPDRDPKKIDKLLRAVFVVITTQGDGDWYGALNNLVDAYDAVVGG